MKAEIIENNEGMDSLFYPDLVNFPISFHKDKAEVEPKGLIIPLSLFSEEEDKGLEFSPQEIYRATLRSGFKIASAKEYLENLDRSFNKLFSDQSFSSNKDFSGEQRILNPSLLHMIAVTDRNEDTIGHSQLVARYTLLLAKSLGIEEREVLTVIERGALLHDIGKIGIPESILRKPGALTPGEREIVKEHPLFGYEIIEEFDFLKKAAQVILYHHEHFDGRGYPYGLAGEEIPLEARIFAIADTLDAMTSDRPYRKAGSFEKALEEIEKYSGTQFDPLLVDTLLSIPEEKWLEIKNDPYGLSFSIQAN